MEISYQTAGVAAGCVMASYYLISTGRESVESNYADEIPTVTELGSSTTSSKAVREVIRGHFTDTPCMGMYWQCARNVYWKHNFLNRIDYCIT